MTRQELETALTRINSELNRLDSDLLMAANTNAVLANQREERQHLNAQRKAVLIGLAYDSLSGFAHDYALAYNLQTDDVQRELHDLVSRRLARWRSRLAADAAYRKAFKQEAR